MISAQDIVIAAPLPPVSVTLSKDASEDEVNAIFRKLRQLMKDCEGANEHDRVNVLITACIDEGINEGSRIIGAATRLDFNGRHAGILLSGGIGERWSRDENGTYRNLI